MSRFATLVLTLALSPAWGALRDPEESLNQPSVSLADGIYQLDQDATLNATALETLGEEAPGADVTIPARQPFAVYSEGEVTYVEPLIADEALGTTPDVFTFPRASVAALSPRFLEPGDAITMYEKFAPDSETQVAGRCKHFVQKHLGFHVPGKCASSMTASKLAHVGFQQTSCESAQMKVWSGGPRGCGHVAYRTRGGAWSSTDFVGDPGTGFHAKGCYSRRRRG